MKIKLHFFGVFREMIGSDYILLNIDNTDTLKLKRYLIKNFPSIGDIPFTLCVNDEIVSGNISLKDGDEVAILPPVAGGK